MLVPSKDSTTQFESRDGTIHLNSSHHADKNTPNGYTERTKGIFFLRCLRRNVLEASMITPDKFHFVV